MAPESLLPAFWFQEKDGARGGSWLLLNDDFRTASEAPGDMSNNCEDDGGLLSLVDTSASAAMRFDIPDETCPLRIRAMGSSRSFVGVAIDND